MLGQRLLQQLAAEMKVTDEEIQAHYRTLEPEVSVEANHILLADEMSARKVIGQLEGGATFAALARKLSTDTETRDKGGQLDDMNTSELAVPFAQAATALKPGNFTHQPVRTDHGWHVIQLRSMRTLEKPPFESLRASLRTQIVNERLQAQIAQWRRQAKLSVLQAP